MADEVWRSNKPRGIAAWGDKAGAVIGGVLGGIYSGGAGTAGGAMAGATKGSQIGGMVGNLLGQNTAPGQNVDSPAGRRLQSMGGNPAATTEQAEDPQKALEEARLALQTQSPEVRQQYEPAIQAAMLKSRRGTA